MLLDDKDGEEEDPVACVLELADAPSKGSPQVPKPTQVGFIGFRVYRAYRVYRVYRVQDDLKDVYGRAFGAEYGNGRHYRYAVCCSSWTVAQEAWEGKTDLSSFPGPPALVVYDIPSWGPKSQNIRDKRQGQTYAREEAGQLTTSSRLLRLCRRLWYRVYRVLSGV